MKSKINLSGGLDAKSIIRQTEDHLLEMVGSKSHIVADLIRKERATIKFKQLDGKLTLDENSLSADLISAINAAYKDA